MGSVAAINQLMAIITSMMDEEPDYDLEIVGLRSGTNDRSCCQHEICGARWATTTRKAVAPHWVVSILTYRSSDGRCLSSPAFQRAQGMCNSLEQLALSRSLWLVLLHIAFVESLAVFGQASCLATVKKSDGEMKKMTKEPSVGRSKNTVGISAR